MNFQSWANHQKEANKTIVISEKTAKVQEFEKKLLKNFGNDILYDIKSLKSVFYE